MSRNKKSTRTLAENDARSDNVSSESVEVKTNSLDSFEETSTAEIKSGEKNSPSKKRKEGKPKLKSKKKSEIPPSKFYFNFNADECPIFKVTVFTDRAEVTRLVKVHLLPGQTEIVISSLTPLIDLQSLRIAGTKEKATLLEVSGSLVRNQLDQDCKEVVDYVKKTAELEAEINEKYQALDRTQKQLKWLDSWANFLVSSNAPSPLLMSNSPIVPVLPSYATTNNNNNNISDNNNNFIWCASEFLRFYEDKLKFLTQEEYQTKKHLKDLEESLAKCKSEYEEFLAKSSEPRHSEVFLLIEARESFSASLTLSYLVSEVRWTPFYEFKVQTQEQTLLLYYYGKVNNGSKENWNNVSLTLSSMKPSIGGKPPDLKTKWIHLEERKNTVQHFQISPDTLSLSGNLVSPLYVKSTDSIKSTSSISAASEPSLTALSTARLPDDQSRCDVPPENTKGRKSTTKQSNLSVFGVTYQIPKKVSIPSNNKNHKVTTFIHEVNATFSYTITPSLAQTAFLKARFTNIFDILLLPGKAVIFLDSNFVAKTEIPAVHPQSSISIFLGIDNNIKVLYKSDKKFVPTKIKGQKKEEFTFTSTITNTKTSRIEVHLFEQLPKSADNDLKVKLTTPDLDVSSAPRSVDQIEENAPIVFTPGHNIRWRVPLQPQESREIKFTYCIEFPSNRTYRF